MVLILICISFFCLIFVFNISSTSHCIIFFRLSYSSLKLAQCCFLQTSHPFAVSFWCYLEEHPLLNFLKFWAQGTGLVIFIGFNSICIWQTEIIIHNNPTFITLSMLILCFFILIVFIGLKFRLNDCYFLIKNILR